METKLINVTKFSQCEKMTWIKENYRPFGWPEQEYLPELEKKEIDAEFLVSFSNGETMGCGGVLYGLKRMDDQSFRLFCLSILADDIFGGGPTQQVNKDFLKFGLPIIKTNLNANVVFELKEIYISSYGKTDVEIIDRLQAYSTLKIANYEKNKYYFVEDFL